NVIHASQLCFSLSNAALGRFYLRLGLRDTGYVLGVDCVRHFVGGLLGVVVGFGNQRVLEKVLSAIIIKLGAAKIGSAAFELCLRGVEGGFSGYSIGLGAGDGGARHGDVGGGLHVFKLRQNLVFLYLVTFAHEQADDPPHGVCAYVDDRLGLDLAGSRDHGRSILLIDLACLNSNNVLLALVEGEANNRPQQYDDPTDNENFLCVHEIN